MRRWPLLVGLFAPLTLAWAEDDDEEKAAMDFEMVEIAAPAPMKMRAKMSATVGGAQDIGYFRDVVKRGDVPAPEVITSGGLLGEHDLPGPEADCEVLLCPTGQAVQTSLAGQPDVTWVAQLGFTSGLDASSFERPPLDLVAVIDRSCSMTGDKFETVRKSLETVAKDLGPKDRLSIVTYGADVDVELKSAPGGDPAIAQALRRLAIDGSTNMEAGLTVGFDLARQERKTFDGVTRVMLFTDEQPNTGRTDAQSFMGMAEQASKDGIGMTTIGVGTDFGAELAQQISAVRGGNLFFFADVAQMQEKFAEELDTMVVELAYDVDIEVKPAPGSRIAGVYGIPGEAFTWTEGGGLKTSVKTLFASKEGGGIFFAFAPEGDRPIREGTAVGVVRLAYTARDLGRTESVAPFTVVSPTKATAGLTRGTLLVEEYVGLKLAAMRYRAGDVEGAKQALAPVAKHLSASTDPKLSEELDLVRTLEATLGKSQAVASLGPVDLGQISGLPVR